MKIVNLPNEETFIRRVAGVLLDGFTTSGINPWEDLDEATQEVQDSLSENRISRAAIDDDGNIMGWIGAIYEYALVWELHPLVVRSDLQNQGIGTALAKDLEAQIKSAAV